MLRFTVPPGTPLLAVLIARREGYGVPGKIPTTHNNPGDLRHSPHSDHDADELEAIGDIDTPEHGWQDLIRQLHLYASRGLTLEVMITKYYAPSNENNSAAYLAFVCKEIGLKPHTFVSDALTII